MVKKCIYCKRMGLVPTGLTLTGGYKQYRCKYCNHAYMRKD